MELKKNQLRNHVLLTGATGFIGQAVLQRLNQDDARPLIAAVRSNHVDLPHGVLPWQIDDLAELDKKSSDIFKDVSVVVHCAARAHIMREMVENPLDIYRRVNVQGTLKLAQQAAQAGVRRFVFISSVKVNGEWTSKEQPFDENSPACPQDDYGLSKYEAEQALWQVVKNSTMEVVIIRPPLVYGPGVKGNFASMLRWVRKRVPLPFGAVDNRRSLVALDNLVDFIVLCAKPELSPQAANQVFFISDGEDISTGDLLRKVAVAYGVKPRLWPVSERWMRWGAGILGKKALADRLFGSLVVDARRARNLLAWQPVISMDEQLKKMAKYDADI